jgi:hypothetical protein
MAREIIQKDPGFFFFRRGGDVRGTEHLKIIVIRLIHCDSSGLKKPPGIIFKSAGKREEKKNWCLRYKKVFIVLEI